VTSLMMIRGSIRLGVSFIFDKDFHPYANNPDLSVSEENFPKNLKLVDTLTSIAEKKGTTASQLTLSWLLAQGDDVFPVRTLLFVPSPSYLAFSSHSHSPFLSSLPTPLHIETNTPTRSQAPLPSPASRKTTPPLPSTSTTKRQQKSEKHVKKQLYMERDIQKTF